MRSNTANETTATAENKPYTGRFAPSPTGDLHFGSLLTAAASFLDAQSSGGRWLLRIEDLDRAREVPGCTDRMLRTLDAFGFEWAGDVAYQSRRIERYESALATLEANGSTYRCRCTRRELAALDRYPGTCRNRHVSAAEPFALRLRMYDTCESFVDRIQGPVVQNVAAAGDLIVKRRDGIIAYALAVVVDDEAQQISHVVRGADLLSHTGGQIHLQHRLGLPSPAYAHVPVLTEPDGSKLAKSRRSVGIDSDAASHILYSIFKMLGMNPPQNLDLEPPRVCWAWAKPAWRCEAVPKRASIALAD